MSSFPPLTPLANADSYSLAKHSKNDPKAIWFLKKDTRPNSHIWKRDYSYLGILSMVDKLIDLKNFFTKLYMLKNSTNNKINIKKVIKGCIN